MNSGSQLRGRALFEKVITIWHSRTDRTEGLTLNQIANLALGSGTSQNAGIIGRTLNEFIDYFHPPRGQGRKWRVNWEKIRRDHPNLVSLQPLSTISSQVSRLEGMKRALDDEIRAVQCELIKHPLIGLGITKLGMLIEGSFLYEAIIELPTSDSEPLIPEGVGIRLRWQESYEIDATLLSYDSLRSTIIFEVDHPLKTRCFSRGFYIFPRIDELLKAVKTKLLSLEASSDALSWRLLNNNATPRQRPWSYPINKRNLDDAQLNAITRCLNQDITFIWGPPGTGKTYTLARLMTTAALGGQKIIATAIANIAVDQMALQLVRALEESGRSGQELLNKGAVLRFGHPRLPEVSGEAKLFPNKQEIQQLRRQLYEARQQHRKIPQHDAKARALSQNLINHLTNKIRRLTKITIEHAHIVLTTAVQICLEPALSEIPYNMMVVDEASMMPIPYLACMGLIGKDRLIIAGDFRQLGPIAISRSQAALDWLHKDAFELVGIACDLTQLPSHPALAMLCTQRRMHPNICDLVNRSFYGGKLETAIYGIRKGGADLPPLPGKQAVLVSLSTQDGSQVELTEGGSRRNQLSANVTLKLAKRFLQSNQKIEVGIITPYRAQVSLIKRLLRDANLTDSSRDRLKIGTVHAFQGSEADVIIWDLVDTEHHTIGKPYQGETGNRLANVAITRARTKLVLVGDRNVLLGGRGSNMIGAFRNILGLYFRPQLGNVILARELWLSEGRD